MGAGPVLRAMLWCTGEVAGEFVLQGVFAHGVRNVSAGHKLFEVLWRMPLVVGRG